MIGPQFIKDIKDLFNNKEEILGLNERNLIYLRPSNKKHARKVADNKILTKKLLVKNKMSTPKILAEIKSQEELYNFDWEKLPKAFALKPKKGYQGQGILVVTAKSNRTGNWIQNDGKQVDLDNIRNRVQRILEGEYSLRNELDTAFFEELIITNEKLAQYAYKGVPDIRVIVYNKVPVMAELRLPTKASDGKANLHRGGIIVGIDMASGTTTTAVQYDNIIEYHPDNDKILSGIKIPYWNKILELSVQCQIVTDIGFLGADIVVDQRYGPMVIELNARPGLGIQIANQDGLKGRLKRVKGLKIKTIARGVAVAKSLFGGDIEESIEEISGKQLIGIIEKAKFYNLLTEEKVIVKVKNDTGAYRTSISYEIAKKLGLGATIEKINALPFEKKNLSRDEAIAIKRKWNKVVREDKNIHRLKIVKASNGISIRPVVNVKFEMSGIIVETKATIEERSGMSYGVIIGQRDLKKFLIDASK
jgi:alpha-L-glutamate ligase-like protein